MKTNRIIITAIAAAFSLSPLYGAEEKKPAAKEEPKHEAGKKHDDHGKKVDVKIPETAEALWAEIDAKHKALTEAVAAKKADGLHEIAETLEALVNAVPAKHTDLAADKKKRVEGGAKNIARVLDALHEEGEEGPWDDVAKKLTQVDSALATIKAQVAK